MFQKRGGGGGGVPPPSPFMTMLDPGPGAEGARGISEGARGIYKRPKNN